MKKLGLCNVDSVLSDVLSIKYDITTLNSNDMYADTILIDWIPDTHEKHKTLQLILQVSLIKKHIKNNKIKIIVFDRHLSISADECIWLKKNGVILLEPALNYRKDFDYLPAWIKTKTSRGISLETPAKKFDIVFNGSPSDNMLHFEEYLLTYCKESTSNRNVVYSKPTNSDKTMEYNDAGLLQATFDYKDAKFALLLDTPKHYRIGYIHPDLPKILEADCIPLIPCENKYYGSMSNIVNDYLSILMYTSTYDKLYYGYVLDVYDYIDTFYPEMFVENVAKTLELYIN